MKRKITEGPIWNNEHNRGTKIGGLIFEKFGGFDLFVVYLNENCS